MGYILEDLSVYIGHSKLIMKCSSVFSDFELGLLLAFFVKVGRVQPSPIFILNQLVPLWSDHVKEFVMVALVWLNTVVVKA